MGASVKSVKQREPSVFLSVSKGDPLVCTAIFDRTASRKRLVSDFRKALPKLDPPPPYREVDARILQAVQIKRASPHLSFKQVSVEIFGTPDRAERIRYWFNWYGQLVGEQP